MSSNISVILYHPLRIFLSSEVTKPYHVLEYNRESYTFLWNMKIKAYTQNPNLLNSLDTISYPVGFNGK